MSAVDQNKKGERLAKRIAGAGVCSRRDAEKLIESGDVTVNDEIILSPVTFVTDDDKITVKGKTLATKQHTRLWCFHKPRGFLTTNRDPEGRPTIFDLLPQELKQLKAIGRLDMNTEGLLLLTNDGALSRFLELPANEWERVYKLRAFGQIKDEDLAKIRDGITVEGISYKPAGVEHLSSQGQNHWLRITLTEGKNREVRKLCEAVGLQVNRLLRLSFGPFSLGDVRKGDYIEINPKILKRKLPSFFDDAHHKR